MSKIKFVLIVSIMLLFNVSTLFGATVDNEVRIGLEANFKNINNLTINNSQIEFGYNENNEFKLGGILNAIDKFNVRNSNSYFLKIDQNYSSLSNALTAAETYKNVGYNAGVGYEVDNTWYVVIGEFTSQEATVAQGELAGTILNPRDKRVVIYDGNNLMIVFESNNSPQVKGLSSEYISLSGSRYRGRIEILFTSGNLFTPINVLSLEEYLYAVVPSEMPSSWHSEALKAQAVAARTYARTTMTKHSVDGYNMCDGQHCQVYLGVNNEIESTSRAVDGTNGMVAYYNNMPINAVFHSSNGGVAANSGDVWVNDIPYLQEKVDPYDKDGKVWSRTLSLDDLDFLLSKNSVSIGKATGISVDKMSLNGRVLQLSIIGTNGTHKLEKENIRYFFADGKLPSLESRVFTVKSSDGNSQTTSTTTTVNKNISVTNGNTTTSDVFNNFYVYNNGKNSSIDNNTIYVLGKNGVTSYSNSVSNDTTTTTNGKEIIISGKGWGHGVGLSQYGAKGMAENGSSFTDILKFYYTGVEIR